MPAKAFPGKHAIPSKGPCHTVFLWHPETCKGTYFFLAKCSDEIQKTRDSLIMLIFRDPPTFSLMDSPDVVRLDDSPVVVLALRLAAAVPLPRQAGAGQEVEEHVAQGLVESAGRINSITLCIYTHTYMLIQQ